MDNYHSTSELAMNQSFNKIMAYLLSVFFPLLLIIDGQALVAQSTTPPERTRACFDFDWQFHKGNIAMKRAVKAGAQGGITDKPIRYVIYPKPICR